jgi:hypothetical protein
LHIFLNKKSKLHSSLFFFIQDLLHTS